VRQERVQVHEVRDPFRDMLEQKRARRALMPRHDGVMNPYAHGELAVVIDCADLGRSARFWTGVLGYVTAGTVSGSYQTLSPVGGHGIEVLLQRTADAKHGKNRVHLDLRTRDLGAEVSRVTALGATVLTASPVVEDGWLWHILADPDGNEFCVLRPPDGYWPELAGGGRERGVIPRQASRYRGTTARARDP
jgi:predicted enzyme related to lactoylglutathione lyase